MSARATTARTIPGEPVDARAWVELQDDLARWLAGPAPGCPLELEVAGAPAATGAATLSGELAEVGLAAARLARARDARRRTLLVRASGRVVGPLLSLALSADLLLVDSAMVGALLAWQDRPLPLPGDLPALERRLGRAGALAVGLLGRTVTASELLGSGGALTGPAGESAWREARRASPVAQAAAVALLARRETGRAAAEALERAAFALCFAARDRGEGVLAFLDKREPRFHETPAQDGWGRPPGGAPGPLPEEDPA